MFMRARPNRYYYSKRECRDVGVKGSKCGKVVGDLALTSDTTAPASHQYNKLLQPSLNSRRRYRNTNTKVDSLSDRHPAESEMDPPKNYSNQRKPYHREPPPQKQWRNLNTTPNNKTRQHLEAVNWNNLKAEQSETWENLRYFFFFYFKTVSVLLYP